MNFGENRYTSATKEGSVVKVNFPFGFIEIVVLKLITLLHSDKSMANIHWANKAGLVVERGATSSYPWGNREIIWILENIRKELKDEVEVTK